MPIPALPQTGIIDGIVGLTTDGMLASGSLGILVNSLDIDTVPDNGGIKVTASGFFPVDTDIVLAIVRTSPVLARECYSGVVGQGSAAQSADGLTLSFVVPPFPIGGPYDLTLTPAVGLPVTVNGAITYIHRTFATTLFSLRANAATPRNVGPRSIEDED